MSAASVSTEQSFTVIEPQIFLQSVGFHDVDAQAYLVSKGREAFLEAVSAYAAESGVGPEEVAGQPETDCVETSDQWEFVVSKDAGDAMSGRTLVAHMKPAGCDQLLYNRLPVAVCHIFFGRGQPAFCRL